MFTGIIESTGEITGIKAIGKNIQFTIVSELAGSLKADQSLAHNGVCLTVESADKTQYQVTAIDETLKKSNLGTLKKGDLVNLERSLTLQSRLDGHLVQGHVDAIAKCTNIDPHEGSYVFAFSMDKKYQNLIVEKGSITVNGVSLTCFDCKNDRFSVAIIPYTIDHTNFKTLRTGDSVNLEFDIIGKYVQRMAHPWQG